SQHAGIDALLAELEIEPGDHPGQTHHVVKVIELDGGGDYDEIDALIAELEADLASTPAKHELVKVYQHDTSDVEEIDALIAELEADLANDFEILEEEVQVDFRPKASDQSRVQELEKEVTELRELVESLVKELNKR
ncbi:MAG: hypothetical protein P1V81_00530, partial [Planctomycetota bacterium]|nr:hypothetical protein [Planctomycetota bacterium]